MTDAGNASQSVADVLHDAVSSLEADVIAPLASLERVLRAFNDSHALYDANDMVQVARAVCASARLCAEVVTGAIDSAWIASTDDED